MLKRYFLLFVFPLRPTQSYVRLLQVTPLLYTVLNLILVGVSLNDTIF